jgi:dolichol kinase
MLSECVPYFQASVVGVWKGFVRWPDTNKTLEGSIAAFLSTCLCIKFMSLGCGTAEPNLGTMKTIPATLLMVLMEASTDQIDNLVLPLYYYTALMFV